MNTQRIYRHPASSGTKATQAKSLTKALSKSLKSQPNDEKKFLKMLHRTEVKKMKDRKAEIWTDRKKKHETLWSSIFRICHLQNP